MSFKRWLALLVLAAAAPVTWAAFKPIRVLAPQWAGTTCDGAICVEDPVRLDEARALYRDALDFVDRRVGRIEAPPRMVFCATLVCSQRFGFRANAAYTVGTSGIVISHRGWAPFFVRHELIHHLQNERLGTLRAGFCKPDWWREGMAYSLSEDPRHPLTAPLEGWRAAYEAWQARLRGADPWQAAASL